VKSKVDAYKNSMVLIFKEKYGVLELQARKWIRDYDFNRVLKVCNYIALHDDPEVWVDAIYKWANSEEELLEM